LAFTKGAETKARSNSRKLQAAGSELQAALLRARSFKETRRKMPEVVVARPREGKFNKNAARRVRAAGKIPAVLYGSGHDAVAVELDPKQISRILFSETGRNTIFDVEVAGQPAASCQGPR
jgi:ribosomal protein L25 (general stress protein Ctc)